MHRNKHGRKIFFIIGFFLAMLFSICGCASLKTSGNKTDVKIIDTQSLESAGLKELENKEEQTKAAIEQKQEALEKTQQEAAAVAQSKEELQKQAQLKKEEAEAKKQEAAILKKEAKIKKDATLLKEAKTLTKEAIQLEQEADAHTQRLKDIESREQVTQKKLDEHQSQIELLRKSLQDIKLSQAAKRGLVENAKRSVPILLIGIFIFIILKMSLRSFEKMLSRKEAIREDEVTLRMKTLSKLINWLSGIVIFIIVAYFILENFGFSVAPLLAGAGIAGIAFGFGGQYLIRDLINGIFILLEDQYRINDVVKIGDCSGLVEEINLRITTLRDLDGRVIIIPNGEIKTVINYTKGYAQALLDIRVAYKENVDRVMEVIKKIGKELRGDAYYGRLIIGDLEMLGVDDFADSAVVIKFRMKTLPIKQWDVMREFRRRLKNKFDELGIEMPFPQRTLHWGENQENRASGKS